MPAFGAEREWEQTHTKTVDGLVTIGTLFGDDEALMRAKADRVYQVLREIVEEVPSLQITTRLPENLSDEQLEQMTAALEGCRAEGHRGRHDALGLRADGLDLRSVHIEAATGSVSPSVCDVRVAISRARRPVAK